MPSKTPVIMYGIISKELIILVIGIDEASGRGDSDSQMPSFEVIMSLKTPIDYENPIVRCVALPRLGPVSQRFVRATNSLDL